MLAGGNSTPVCAQQVTTKAPSAIAESHDSASGSDLPESPDLPIAKIVLDEDATIPVSIDSDSQSKLGSRYTLDGNVVIHYRDRTVEADHIEYDTESGDVVATGHLHATGGRNHEEIRASHGAFNLKSQIGSFFDVKGSVGVRSSGNRVVYLSGNPFLFTGREVRKTGEQTYEILDGSVTSCRLPHPDWLLSAGLFSVDDEKARARNSVFRLRNIPLLYLPYVTHPVDSEGRQSGLLIPIIGQSSTKGLVLGEQLYVALSRSTDLTLGVQYFSRRGWLDQFTFRHRGLGDDFLLAHYSQLFDRGIGFGASYANQGGEDLTVAGRHDFSPTTRVAADIEYLSSYVYREAFSESFNQAVSTDITSVAYGVHTGIGFTESVEADRYQGLKRVPTAGTLSTAGNGGQQVRIFHVPSLNLSAVDHALGATGLQWSFDASASGLKRVQPNFVTNGVTERLDLHPQVAFPLSAAGWHLRPALGVRETFYSRSRTRTPNVVPTELQQTLNRADLEADVDLRAPVVARTFAAPWLKRLAGGTVRHAVEPELHYRYVTGIDNFSNILRFDDRDIVSNTNELEYGVTQRFFVRRTARDSHGTLDTRCGAAATNLDAPVTTGGSPAGIDTGSEPGLSAEVQPATPLATPKCTSREWISWRVAQKTFFDPGFGGAVVPGRRNIFATTLDFAGVAFLTERRDISPVISRLRIRTTDHLDVEWDADLDTGAKKFTANNLLLDLHTGNSFAGLSYARLNAPGRSYVEGVSSLTADFNQMRVLLGYGRPTKPGLSLAANAGLDLDRTQVQYGAVQTSYNWNCCGFSVEYRKYQLGSVRNENVYRFNFTLANIGTAGNLRRAERLF